MKEKISFYVYGHMPVPKGWNRRTGGGANNLYYIHSGRGGYEIAGVEYEFEKDTFYLLPGTAKVVTWSDNNDPIIHTYCDFELFPSIISSQVLVMKPDDDPFLRASLEIFISGGKIAHDLFIKGFPQILPKEKENLFAKAVTYIAMRVVENYSEVLVKDEAILNAMYYMHVNMSEKISVENLASVAFMSEGGFIKRFKKITGFTPYAYLKKIRLNTAYYLKQEGLTLEDISERVGYSDSVSLLHAMQRKKLEEEKGEDIDQDFDQE